MIFLVKSPLKLLSTMVKFIIVFGTANCNNSKKRVDRATEEFFSYPYENFSDHDLSCEPLTYVLLTGTQSEILEMSEYILKKIDKKFLIFDQEARSTIDNIENTKKIIKKLYPVNFGYTPSIVMCSSTYHIKRVAVISQFILKEYEDVSYIHTNEIVDAAVAKLERCYIDQFLTKILKI